MSATNPCLLRKKVFRKKNVTVVHQEAIWKFFTKKDFDGLGVRVRTYELVIFIVLAAPFTINLVY